MTDNKPYPDLPKPVASSGYFPVYSSHQMRAYVDADRAMRAAEPRGFPPSYEGSSLIGKPGGSCAVNLHFGNAEEAESWLESLESAAPAVAQAAPADFTEMWTGYLKDGETPFERFMRERKDLDALTTLYRKALEEIEHLKAAAPAAVAGPTKERLIELAEQNNLGYEQQGRLLNGLIEDGDMTDAVQTFARAVLLEFGSVPTTQAAPSQDAEDASRYRWLRRKFCLTGNGDGTCSMHAINLPASIKGWPEPLEAEVMIFCDAAIDAARAQAKEGGK